jgi:hypothetical protein
MTPKNIVFITVAALTILVLYCSLVFLGYAALFGIYQFLRDYGYGFWSAVSVMVLGSSFLAVPSIVARLQLRKK